MSSPKDIVANAIKDNDVMIFSKTTCGYCTRAKRAISDLNIKYTAIELDTMSDGSAIQQELYNLTRQRTVPNIFVKGKHIGGCDDTLAKISTGEFQRLAA